MSTTLDPAAFGRAAARATLRSIPGGGQSTLLRDRSHVTVRPLAPATPTVMVAVTTLEASLIRQMLRASGAQSCIELAARIEQQCHPSQAVYVETDPTPAHGMPRPGAS